MKFRPLALAATLALASLSSPATADPPARVGRIAQVQGGVTVRNNASGDAQSAMVNWPITSGNEIITDGRSRADLRLGSAAVRIDGNSDLEIIQLDDQHFTLRLHRGTAAFQIRNPDLARDTEITLPQGRIVLREPTSLRIDVGASTTVLNVLSGAVNFDGTNTRFALPAGRRAEVVNGNLRLLEPRNPVSEDEFDAWTAQQDRQLDRAPSRYVSVETTGYEELDRYGMWRETTTYGPVWSPRNVASDWAPYRDGRWTWIAPWGWTWVDQAPWGYAPSHYGRWVFFEQRWCWTPGGVIVQPVWAPAVVGWVGGSSWQIAFNSGSAPAVGWFPLAPREAYFPNYQASPTYIQQINNTVTYNRNIQIQNYYYDGRQQTYQYQTRQNAVTVLPQDQFSVQKTIVVSPGTVNQLPSYWMGTGTAAPRPATVSPPAPVNSTVLPSYRQRVTPMMGPIMQGNPTPGLMETPTRERLRSVVPAPMVATPAPRGVQLAAPEIIPLRQAPSRPPMTVQPSVQPVIQPAPVAAMGHAPAQGALAVAPAPPAPVSHRVMVVQPVAQAVVQPQPAPPPALRAASQPIPPAQSAKRQQDEAIGQPPHGRGRDIAMPR